MEKTRISTEPKMIHSILSEYVIGQEYAKRVLSVAICNHFLRRELSLQTKEFPERKSNLLLIGSSGTGKTLLAETITDNMDLPFIHIDATTLGDPRVGGRSPESILSSLYYRLGENIESTEKGIVFIDEFDKLRKMDGSIISHGERIQQGLLKLLEGHEIEIVLPGDKRKTIVIDGHQILFICAGTFVGIEEIVSERLKYERWVERDTLLMKTEPEDLVKFGIIPELVSRIPLIAPLHDLSTADLLRIITEPKDSLLLEYTMIFKELGVELTFSQDALEQIAKESLKTGNGARGLRMVFETVLLNFMFTKNNGNPTLNITADIVKQEVNRERKRSELKKQLKNLEFLLNKYRKELETLGTQAPPPLINKMKGLERKVEELQKKLKHYP